jgi:very-short-patch-repair endonuclease
MNDIKRDYLVKALSRTKRKDYENYVINAIWHSLHRFDLQPCTQQYIKRSDGRYALLDLFFPQINIGIECDEVYHRNNVDNDLKREMTMEDVLSSYDETADFELFRIKMYVSLPEIDQHIQTVVSRINEKALSTKFESWDLINPPYIKIINAGKIVVRERLGFSTITDICKCFGRDSAPPRKCFFHIGNGYQIWCPKLAIEKDGTLTSVANGWKNVLSINWDYLTETNDGKPLNGFDYLDRPRITFGKSKDIFGRDQYRFLGVYVACEEKSSAQKNVYKRICTELEIKAVANVNDE